MSTAVVQRSYEIDEREIRIEARREEAVTAKGYILTQEELISNLEVLAMPEFAVFEAPISQIGDMTGPTLSAGSAPEAAGRRRRGEAVSSDGQIRRIASVRQIAG